MLVQNSLRIVGISFDLVIIYREGGEYHRPIASMIEEIVSQCSNRSLMNTRGGIYSIDLNAEPEETALLFRASSVSVATQTMTRIQIPQPEYKPFDILNSLPQTLRLEHGLKCAGGYFSGNSFYCNSDTKVPWCHVLANPVFGTLVSNKSLGFTWAVNSRENKLTPWNNDVMSDNRGEWLIAEIDGKYYDLICGSMAEFHPGYARYYAIAGDLEVTTTVAVAEKGMKKVLGLELHYTGDHKQKISVAYYLEPVLGVSREDAEHLVSSEDAGTVTVINPFQQAVRSIMAVTSDALDFHCCYDRVAFFSGRWKEENSLPNNEPCLAYIVECEFNSGGKQTLNFQLSFQSYEKGLEQLHLTLPPEKQENRITVSTPDQQLNALFNTWLLHQAHIGRMRARTAFYQCGGAWGFRDQLQDSCAVLYRDPDVTKVQILRCCASQFEEGDVLHWWHQLPEFGGGKKGVRTRYSDDLLWLPYTVCEYLDKTGDSTILSIPVAYCTAPVLEKDEAERYVEVVVSQEKGTVYDHCIRAIDYASSRLGEHGIPLIGGGDWNDGLNHVGIGGKGESVWLAQFLSLVLKRFSNVCKLQGDEERAEKYQLDSQRLLEQVDRHCWDGEWYLRAFTDSGEALGSSKSEEGKIDSLPQSFSVISNMKDEARTRLAVNRAYELLADREAKLVRLFTPAFDQIPLDLGYIKSYPTGIRENGGQYTHAAVWLAIALLESGEYEKGYDVIRMLNPINHSMTEQEKNIYLLEPYYIAADIYTNRYNYGRGGWSIYTGAAAWYYRCILESLLGIQMKDKSLFIHPRIPQEWQGYTAKLNLQDTQIDLTVKRADRSGMLVNGISCDAVALDGGEKLVEVMIP